VEVWNRLKITRARDFGSLAGWLPASPVSANEDRVLRKLPEKASMIEHRAIEAGAPPLSTSSIPVVEHTARAPGALPSPSPSTALPTPAGDGHGRRLYVAPPAVGIAASPGGYMPHPEHPDFFPIELVSTHRRRPLIIRAYT